MLSVTSAPTFFFAQRCGRTLCIAPGVTWRAMASEFLVSKTMITWHDVKSVASSSVAVAVLCLWLGLADVRIPVRHIETAVFPASQVYHPGVSAISPAWPRFRYFGRKFVPFLGASGQECASADDRMEALEARAAGAGPQAGAK